MTEPISKTKLIDFSDWNKSEEQKACYKASFNSVMMSIANFEKYDEVDHFTYCEGCQMILTAHDEQYVYRWAELEENQHMLKDWKHSEKMRASPYYFYMWECRFCQTKNLVPKDDIVFAGNRTKQVLKNESKETVSNNTILLFVIDNSSSMEETIVESNEAKVKQLVNSLKQKDIYQKISQAEEKKLKEIKNSHAKDSSSGYEDHLSKNKLLMGLTEHSIKNICSNTKPAKKPFNRFEGNPPERKIGFIFFNSKVILQKKAKDKDKSVIMIEEASYANQQSSETNKKVDFHNHKELFLTGKQTGSNYGVNFDQFDFKDLEMNIVNPTGQTALGPALFVAAGVASNYGPGSLIVLVTDGEGNRGILSEDQSYMEQLQFLNMQLERSKCEACLIQLQNKKKEEQNFKTPLDIFYHKKKQVRVNIEEKIQTFHRNLSNIITAGYEGVIWKNQIQVKCQNSHIDYSKSIYEIKSKLFTGNQKQFLKPNFKQDKFKPTDYLYPFMTQIIVKYQNINTKKQQVFMTYMIQKLVKYTQMKKKDLDVLNSDQTLQNVLDYLDLEQRKMDFDDIPLSIIQRSFRDSIGRSMSMSIDQRSCRYDDSCLVDALWAPSMRSEMREMNQEDENKL